VRLGAGFRASVLGFRVQRRWTRAAEARHRWNAMRGFRMWSIALLCLPSEDRVYPIHFSERGRGGGGGGGVVFFFRK
jgi:hypothetical protein